MRILDTYCREGAPSAVAAPMSNACRSTTLSCKASSAFIFDTARSEMLQKMGIEIEPHRSVSFCYMFVAESSPRCVVWNQPPAFKFAIYVQLQPMRCRVRNIIHLIPSDGIIFGDTR